MHGPTPHMNRKRKEERCPYSGFVNNFYTYVFKKSQVPFSAESTSLGGGYIDSSTEMWLHFDVGESFRLILGWTVFSIHRGRSDLLASLVR